MNKGINVFNIDPDPIFGVKSREYNVAEKLFELKRISNNEFAGVILTNLDKKTFIKFTIINEYVVRVEFNPIKDFFIHNTLFCNVTTKFLKVEFRTAKKFFEIKTTKIRIIIYREPYRIEIFYNKDFKLRENSIDKTLWGYVTSPIGYYTDNKNTVTTFVSFILDYNEHIYGLGERYTKFDRVGTSTLLWNQDTWGTNSTELSYINVPFFMSSKNYGIFINSSSKIKIETGSYSAFSNSFSVEEDYLDYFIILGKSLKHILSIYTGFTGRAEIPPKWSFGVWFSRCMYKDREEVEDVTKKLRKFKIPSDVIHIDPLWLKGRKKRGYDTCEFEWDDKAFPAPKEMVKKLRDNGFKLSLWENPYVARDTEMYKEGKKNRFFPFKKNQPASPYNLKEATLIDYTNPEAVKWIKKKHKELYKIGVAVFKPDYGEWSPEEAKYYKDFKGIHNLYAYLYTKTIWESSKEFFGEGIIWTRSGWAGSQKFPVHWAGDSQTYFEVLPSVLRAGLNLALSGFQFWSNDIGGFCGPMPSEKLYIRWAQFGLFCSHSRFHGTTPREPWFFGEKALKIIRKFINIRYKLLPYIYTFAHISSKTGMPFIRPLVLEFQNDENTYYIDDEYMFGESLLIAPVVTETDVREIYLPEGKWFDFWTYKEYIGGKRYTLKIPLYKLPIFIKNESIIPFGPVIQYIEDKIYPVTLKIFVQNFVKFRLIDKNFKIDYKVKKMANEIILSTSILHTSHQVIFPLYEIKKINVISGDKNLISLKSNKIIINDVRNKIIIKILINNYGQV